MTCIVGYIADDGIYMGADSAGTDSALNQRTRIDNKVFLMDDFVIGFTSSFRMGQLLQYQFEPPEYIEQIYGDIFGYMCTGFIDSLRACFINGGYAQNDKGEESGGVFLVGYKGRLFEIESDYQVAEVTDRYNAVGCGANYALCSLYTNDGTPEEIVLTALECAEYFSAGVRGPFTILKL